MKKGIVLFFILLSFVVFSQDIFEASRHGDLVRIDQLLKINPDTINSKNNNDFSPIIIAAYHRQISTVDFLIKSGANVNVNSPEGTALMAAVYKGDLEMTKLLLKENALTDTSNEEGQTALMYAAIGGHIEITETLLSHGSNKYLKSKSGNTALLYAIKSNNMTLIKILSD